MHRAGKRLSALVAGWTCLALLALSGAAVEAAPVDDPALLLKHADDIKSANHDEFANALKQLDAESASLSPAQQMDLRYLKAWQTAYFGDYATAIPQLNAIIAESSDVTLRFRADMTAVNVLEIASRNEEAYTRLSEALNLLPKVSDHGARRQGLFIAAELYDEAGQYDLALSYAKQGLAEDPSVPANICKSTVLTLHAMYKSGKLRTAGKDFQDGIDACSAASEPIFANSIRSDLAQFDIANDDPGSAIKLLQGSYQENQDTHYPEGLARTDATLAQAYWKTGDAEQAKHYAQRAVDDGIKNEYTEALVGAYQILYQVAKQQGDAAAALAWHEKYAAADKGYLSDESARTLAYQMVHQQVQEKKSQVDALSRQNQVLQLKQAVGRKDMIAVQLGIALLLVVLGSIALYAYRTKRSQLKFQKLARRDGLTEIYNRQYFVEVAEQELAYCRKSVRDVSVVAIDLDHFKHINDTHGHAAGDFALRRAVAACQKHLRSVDVFGRLGGEEFGILMPDCVPERAIDLAEKMRQTIAGLAGENEPPFEITASFGVTAARWSGYDLLQLLAQADSALYQAKREGRNRVVAIAGPPAANSRPSTTESDRRRA